MAKWYYYDNNGEKQGPIRGRQLKELARLGIIAPGTLLETEKGKTTLARNARNLTFPMEGQFETPPLLPRVSPFSDVISEVPEPMVMAEDDLEQVLHEELFSSPQDDQESEIGISPSEPTKKTFFGKYEIREMIGTGGMGNVFSAWDTELRREVTVKVLNERAMKKEHFRERFLNEARITGRLEHSGIVPVYYLDYDQQGMPYYVMRMLEGRTLSQLIAQYHHSKVTASTPEMLRKLLQHFINVCHTIAYAHDHFVVHRDIKPKNIMLGGYGETMVIDWGLAKVLNKTSDDSLQEADASSEDAPAASEPTDEFDGDFTLVTNRLGTAGYQSPEYLRTGISQPSDDIYALGITLYTLMCDRLPHKVIRNSPGLLEKQTVPPKPPHLLNPHVDRPLSAVCLCAMAVDTEKRYPRADRLAADLQRWLDGESVSVYRMNRKEAVETFLKKRAASFAIPLIAFLIGFLMAWLVF